MSTANKDCAAGIAAIKTLHATHPAYTEGAEAAAVSDPVVGYDQAYFCKDTISNQARANTLYVGVFSGILVLIQVITFASAVILLTKVSVAEGGFVDGDGYYN